ncbi:MAG: hypothetical protein ABSA47_10540 [Verrucomicrobiota bacterium]
MKKDNIVANQNQPTLTAGAPAAASRMIFELPKEALPDLQQVAEIDEKSFGSLLEAINEIGPTLTGSQFFTKLAGKAPSLEPRCIRGVLGVAFNLYSIKKKHAAASSPQELAEGVINSDLISKSKAFSSEKRQLLSERLTKLLGLDTTIGVTAKALDVMTEHQRLFCHARILSDIRPVFAKTPETAEAALIIHTLQIGFHELGQHREMYFALDVSDLKKLKQVIERAEKKTAALEAILKQSHVPYIEV